MSRQNYLLIPLLATIIFLTLLAVAVVPMVNTVVEVPAALQDDTRALEMAANGLELAAKENLSVGDEFVLNLDGLSATVRIFDDAGQPTVESIGQAGEASRRLTALFSDDVTGSFPDDIVFLPGDLRGAVNNGDAIDDLSQYGNDAVSSFVNSQVVGGPWNGNVTALTFDGRNNQLPGDGDFLRIGSGGNSELQFTEAGTLGLWVNIDSASGKGPMALFAKGLDRNNYDYGLFLEEDRRNQYTVILKLTTQGGQQLEVSSTVNIPTGDWYHLAGTWSGNQLNLYINGTLNNTFTHSSSIVARVSTADVTIGNFNSKGAIDSFVGETYYPVLVAREILPVEVQSLAQDRRFYYQFNGVGATAYPGDGENRVIDSTIFLNHGEIVNGPILLTADGDGRANEAFDFVEANQQVVESLETLIDMNQPFTVALDVKREELLGQFRDQFFSWSNFLNVEFGSTSFIFGDYTQIRGSEFNISLDRNDVGTDWMRIHITYDGNEANFYLNGSVTDSDSSVGGDFGELVPVRLAIGALSNAFDGEVAAVAIYGRVLSANEIQNLAF